MLGLVCHQHNRHPIRSFSLLLPTIIAIHYAPSDGTSPLWPKLSARPARCSGSGDRELPDVDVLPIPQWFGTLSGLMGGCAVMCVCMCVCVRRQAFDCSCVRLFCLDGPNGGRKAEKDYARTELGGRTIVLRFPPFSLPPAHSSPSTVLSLASNVSLFAGRSVSRISVVCSAACNSCVRTCVMRKLLPMLN